MHNPLRTTLTTLSLIWALQTTGIYAQLNPISDSLDDTNNDTTSPAARRQGKFGCGTQLPTLDVLETISSLFDGTLDPTSLLSPLLGDGGLGSVLGGSRIGAHTTPPALAARTLSVDVYQHAVTTASKNGSITPKMLSDQFDVLRSTFAKSRIRLLDRGATYTVNDTWATAPLDDDMKRALRRGSYAALNVYYQSDISASGLLGVCTLPAPLFENLNSKENRNVNKRAANGTGSPPGQTPEAIVPDGCSVAAGTMPGGDIPTFNAGATAVHEVGHWFGLLHTFQGDSCDGPGDYIDDTPQQAVSTDGCPENPPKDSCPQVVGVDPIHNFMDYSSDAW
ncbi:MAG: hypothetical protein M1825_005447 [Sarcosagium campestre]|nr:MAG: hypothetical protein M1825_005447 [Sarcosagium campestre]